MEDQEKLIDTVVAAYIRQMTLREVSHPRIMLIFSGTPGSGKSTLARKFAQDLQAQYLHNDGIRDIMRSLGIEPKGVPMGPISNRVIRHIMANDKNRFVILDSSLDRTWGHFFDDSKLMQAQPIVVRLDVPIAVIRARIEARGRQGDQELLDNLSNYKKQFDDCCRHVPADVTVGEEYEYSRVLQQVRRVIDNKVGK